MDWRRRTSPLVSIPEVEEQLNSVESVLIWHLWSTMFLVVLYSPSYLEQVCIFYRIVLFHGSWRTTSILKFVFSKVNQWNWVRRQSTKSASHHRSPGICLAKHPICNFWELWFFCLFWCKVINVANKLNLFSNFVFNFHIRFI